MSGFTAEHVRAKGSKMELAGVNFRNEDGVLAGGYDAAITVELQFVDGAIMQIAKSEMEKLDDFQFSLRPATPNA